MTKCIGILTSGGDCAGLNATIRAVTLRAHHGYGWKTIGINEPCFLGHFPERAVMPGVLIVEAMAQAAGALVVHSLAQAAAPAVYFMAIEKAKFRKPVVPGDVMRMPVKALRRRGPVWKFEGKAFVGEDLCAEAEFSAMIYDGTDDGTSHSAG